MKNIHYLKTINPYFKAVWEGDKTFEVRFNDRDYCVGDIVYLREYDHIKEEFLNRLIEVEITYIISTVGEIGFDAIKEGYIVFGFKLIAKFIQYK